MTPTKEPLVTLDKLIRLLLQLLTQKCEEILDDAKEHEPQLGFEHEYFITDNDGLLFAWIDNI